MSDLYTAVASIQSLNQQIKQDQAAWTAFKSLYPQNHNKQEVEKRVIDFLNLIQYYYQQKNDWNAFLVQQHGQGDSGLESHAYALLEEQETTIRNWELDVGQVAQKIVASNTTSRSANLRRNSRRPHCQECSQTINSNNYWANSKKNDGKIFCSKHCLGLYYYGKICSSCQVKHWEISEWEGKFVCKNCFTKEKIRIEQEQEQLRQQRICEICQQEKAATAQYQGQKHCKECLDKKIVQARQTRRTAEQARINEEIRQKEEELKKNQQKEAELQARMRKLEAEQQKAEAERQRQAQEQQEQSKEQPMPKVVDEEINNSPPQPNNHNNNSLESFLNNQQNKPNNSPSQSPSPEATKLLTQITRANIINSFDQAIYDYLTQLKDDNGSLYQQHKEQIEGALLKLAELKNQELSDKRISCRSADNNNLIYWIIGLGIIISANFLGLLAWRKTRLKKLNQTK